MIRTKSIIGTAMGLGALCVAMQAAPAVHGNGVTRYHRPIIDRTVEEDGTSTSGNWSGYAVTGTDFTSATASWVVSAVKCSTGDQYSAFWVGLDGFSSSTVEQTGTSADCNGDKPDYYAWYEFYPAAPVTISMTISPGDVMSASVTYSGSDFTTTIEDVTTGKSESHTGTVSGASRASAEWIAEAPASSKILPLADFGTGEFGDAYTKVAGTASAKDSSTSGDISAFPAADVNQINMGTKKKLKATTSALTDGNSFTVKWDSKG